MNISGSFVRIKSYNLNHEKVLKGGQDQVTDIFHPLTKLRRTMEEERILIPFK